MEECTPSGVKRGVLSPVEWAPHPVTLMQHALMNSTPLIPVPPFVPAPPLRPPPSVGQRKTALTPHARAILCAVQTTMRGKPINAECLCSNGKGCNIAGWVEGTAQAEPPSKKHVSNTAHQKIGLLGISGHKTAILHVLTQWRRQQHCPKQLGPIGP